MDQKKRKREESLELCDSKTAAESFISSTRGEGQVESSISNSLTGLSQSLGLEIVEYSAHSLALFGNSKALKDDLKALGAKFNPSLKKGDGKAAGWIVSKKLRAKLEETIGSIGNIARSAESQHMNSGRERKAAETGRSEPTTLAPTKFEIVDYSEYSLALFGDSKPMKEQLKAIGAKYNPSLKRGDGKEAGWVVSKKLRARLEEIIATHMQTIPAKLEETIGCIGNIARSAESQHMDSERDRKAAETERSDPTTLAPTKFEIVDYSEYSLALFGDSKPMKEQLKAIGAKYNPSLKRGDGKEAGWVVSKKLRARLEETIATHMQTIPDPSAPSSSKGFGS
jgi:hypothetical protein